MCDWGQCMLPGLWLSEESVGDAGAQSLGYYTCAWSPDGRSIVAHGYTGALHLWRRSGAQYSPLHTALCGLYHGSKGCMECCSRIHTTPQLPGS